MKKGISVWAFPDNWPLEKCIKLAKDADFEGIELAYYTSGPITPDTTSVDLKKIKDTFSKNEFDITSLASGIFWEVNLLSNEPSERKEAKSHVVRMLEIASDLELPVILVVPGFLGPFESGPPVINDYQMAYNRVVDSFCELAPMAENLGVSIGIENVWNKFISSPLEMKYLLDDIGSPFIGAYFDVGNCLRTGYPEHWIPILDKHIKGIHFKDFRVDIGNLQAFVPLLDGDVDFLAVMEAIKKVDYNGYCVVEVFSRKEFPQNVILQAGLSLKQIFESRSEL